MKLSYTQRVAIQCDGGEGREWCDQTVDRVYDGHEGDPLGARFVEVLEAAYASGWEWRGDKLLCRQCQGRGPKWIWLGKATGSPKPDWVLREEWMDTIEQHGQGD